MYRAHFRRAARLAPCLALATRPCGPVSRPSGGSAPSSTENGGRRFAGSAPCTARPGPRGARHPDSRLPQERGALVLPLPSALSLRTRCPLPNLRVELPVCTFPSLAFTRACLRSEGAPRTFIPGRAVSCHSEASPQVPVSVRPPSPTGRFSVGFSRFVAAGFIHLRAARG